MAKAPETGKDVDLDYKLYTEHHRIFESLGHIRKVANTINDSLVIVTESMRIYLKTLEEKYGEKR